AWRLRPDRFPFTDPSWEVDVQDGEERLEVLGCGVIHPEVLAAAGIHGRSGWALGVGLDRLAMLLYRIPDIRRLWSDEPPITKDISLWVGPGYERADMIALVRRIGGDLVQRVDLIDEYESPQER